MNVRIGFIFALAFSIPLHAQSATEYEQILLPHVLSSEDVPRESFFFPLLPGTLPGAHGSRWVVEGEWRNPGPEEVCASIFGVPQAICFREGTFRDTSHRPSGPGFISFSGAIHQLQFSYIARDGSRDEDSWGAEIPVVREADFKTDQLILINVPTSPRFRRNLRMYGVDRDGIGDVPRSLKVSVWDATADSLGPPRMLGARIYDLPHFGQTIHLRWVSIAGFDLDFPSIATTERIRIEIENLEGGGKFWAFLTITNNQAQHVTTISPQ